MRKEVFLASLVSLAILATYYAYHQGSTDAFEEWKIRFGVSWPLEEEAYRRLIFEENLISIKKHNADLTQTYKMGINQFSVYTTEEFACRFLNPMPMAGLPNADNTIEDTNDVDWTT